jgi:hypothetical protein
MYPKDMPFLLLLGNRHYNSAQQDSLSEKRKWCPYHTKTLVDTAGNYSDAPDWSNPNKCPTDKGIELHTLWNRDNSVLGHTE